MNFIGGIRLTDLVDIAVVAVLIAVAIGWLRRTRARMALFGLGILGAVYVTARFVGLQLTAWILQGFFAVLVIVLIVIFQEDIRRFFEQVAVWGLRRRAPVPPAGSADVILGAVTRLARSRSGAILVFPGRGPLDRHLEGGVPADARISEPLLLSIFDSHSPGHDGAVVVRGERIERFAVRLPLTTHQEALGPRGTRHAAAIGLSERCDALAVVVSEERGEVSTARNGVLHTLRSPADLAGELRAFLAEAAGDAPTRRPGERWAESVLALLLAILLWMVFAFGSTVIEVTRRAPVVAENVPPGYTIERVDPSEVELTLSGRRRDLYFSKPGDFRVRLDAFLVQFGRRELPLATDRVRVPRNVRVLQIRPDQVNLDVIGPPSPTTGEKR